MVHSDCTIALGRSWPGLHLLPNFSPISFLNMNPYTAQEPLAREASPIRLSCPKNPRLPEAQAHSRTINPSGSLQHHPPERQGTSRQELEACLALAFQAFAPASTGLVFREPLVRLQEQGCQVPFLRTRRPTGGQEQRQHFWVRGTGEKRARETNACAVLAYGIHMPTQSSCSPLDARLHWAVVPARWYLGGGSKSSSPDPSTIPSNPNPENMRVSSLCAICRGGWSVNTVPTIVFPILSAYNPGQARPPNLHCSVAMEATLREDQSRSDRPRRAACLIDPTRPVFYVKARLLIRVTKEGEHVRIIPKL